MAILLSPRLWIAVALAAVLGWTHLTAYQAGKDRVQARWDVAKASEAMQRASDLEQALATQRGLQAQIDTLRKDARNEVARINRNHALALDGLRNRPERPVANGDVPAPARNAEAGQGCTGAELYREDATAALREAYRADLIRIELQACYDTYDAARAGIEATKSTRGGSAASLLSTPHAP